jgi:hypothetical protein
MANVGILYSALLEKNMINGIIFGTYIRKSPLGTSAIIFLTVRKENAKSIFVYPKVSALPMCTFLPSTFHILKIEISLSMNIRAF